MIVNVAFIISIYKGDNLSHFIEAIASIVNQTIGFQNINIYLGIDGELSGVVEEYIRDNDKLFYKILKNGTNKGLAATLNRLIEELEQEEFIFRMDSDDICVKNRVSIVLDEFHNDEDLILIGSDMIEIDDNGLELGRKVMPETLESIIDYSIVRNPFNHSTVALRSIFFTRVGLYDVTLKKSQDYELWSRALKLKVRAKNLSTPLVFFRVSHDFFDKRNSAVNYINELKISFDLMVFFRRFDKLPMILGKLLIRLLPRFIGKIIYEKLREK